MDAYTIRDAAEQLDDLIGRVEAGESVDLSREGRVVARLTPAASADPVPARIDVDALRRVAATLPFDPIDSVADVRRDARY